MNGWLELRLQPRDSITHECDHVRPVGSADGERIDRNGCQSVAVVGHELHVDRHGGDAEPPIHAAA